jgi:predicted NBD/HSP70 family sugar kinase
MPSTMSDLAPPPGPLPTAAATATAGDLLDLIRSGRATTRGELGRVTGLSRTAVSTRLASLAAAGLVLEGDEESATGGRPASTLVLDRDAGLVLAVAIGRSRSQLSVCSLDGTELATVSHDQEVGLGPDVLMPVVVEHLAGMLADLGRSGDEVRGVGLSLAGTVDPVRGASVDSPALAGWDGVPLAAYLREVTTAPLVIDNDCNVMAASERDGHLRAHDDVLVLKASTGLGLGIVAGGHLVRGHRGAAGELGHVKVPAAAGLLCRCGDTGCLEAIAGGWALVRALQADGRTVGHLRDVVELANSGDPDARRMIRESGRHVGEVLAGAVNLLNPAVLVVAGDMARAYDVFVAGLRETLYGNATALATRVLQVVPSTYGDRSGVIGSATMVLDHVLSPAAIDAVT